MKRFFAGKPVHLFAILLLALGAILVFALVGRHSDAVVSQVRIRNQTGMPIKEVEVNGIDYGAIPAGGVTEYRDMESAYTNAKVQMVMNGKRIRLVPENLAEERPLGPGHFTYFLISEHAATMMLIDIQAVRDSD